MYMQNWMSYNSAWQKDWYLSLYLLEENCEGMGARTWVSEHSGNGSKGGLDELSNLNDSMTRWFYLIKQVISNKKYFSRQWPWLAMPVMNKNLHTALVKICTNRDDSLSSMNCEEFYKMQLRLKGQIGVFLGFTSRFSCRVSVSKQMLCFQCIL